MNNPQTASTPTPAGINSTGSDGNTTRDPAETASASAVARERPPFAGLELRRRDWILFQLMRAGLHAFSLLPDFILYPLGILGGYLGYLLDRRHVAIGLSESGKTQVTKGLAPGEKVVGDGSLFLQFANSFQH